MRLAPISYETAHCAGSTWYSITQRGYAIEQPRRPWLRLCVRRRGGWWVVDHYDTGYLVVGVCGTTRARAVAAALAWRPSRRAMAQIRAVA